ncbi:MAG: tripartite tricarboxylate transporter substrate binding protein [Burkholderiales bacterium]|nr:tripartite tricarboxylate transporter substrate binding protein [Burkholderiales bacterium]
MRTTLAVLGLLVACAGTTPAAAQDKDAAGFPSRPMRWIVPVPPGATTDILSRMLAQKMGEAWNQRIVVDNRSGGAYVVGSTIIARATPDGHTVGLLLSPHAVGPFAIKDLPYDPIKDFQPIGLVAMVPGVMVTHPSIPVSTIQDVIAYAKARPGKAFYGSPGQLSSGHMSMELVNLMGGVKITYIGYPGGAPAIADVLGGRIQFVILGPPAVMGHLQTGKLKAIGTTAAKRSPGLPNVPTFAESGLPGFDTSEWYGVFAPANIPRPVLAKLNAEINRIIALPDIKERMLTLGAIPAGGTPEAFSAFVKREMERWGKVAIEVGIKPN